MFFSLFQHLGIHRTAGLFFGFFAPFFLAVIQGLRAKLWFHFPGNFSTFLKQFVSSIVYYNIFA